MYLDVFINISLWRGLPERTQLVCFGYEKRVHGDLPDTPEFWLVHDHLESEK